MIFKFKETFDNSAIFEARLRLVNADSLSDDPAELEGLVLLSASFAQRLLPGILLTALLDDIAAADSRTLIAAFGVSQLQKKISMISTRWLPAVRSLHRLYSLR